MTLVLPSVRSQSKPIFLLSIIIYSVCFYGVDGYKGQHLFRYVMVSAL